MAAILVVSAISLVLVLFFVGQIALISSLVNFGALFGFCLLHVSVVWYYMVRKKSKNYLLHLVVPTLGFLIIGYVLFNADSLAKIGGIVWLVIGAMVFGVNTSVGARPRNTRSNRRRRAAKIQCRSSPPPPLLFLPPPFSPLLPPPPPLPPPLVSPSCGTAQAAASDRHAHRPRCHRGPATPAIERSSPAIAAATCVRSWPSSVNAPTTLQRTAGRARP